MAEWRGGGDCGNRAPSGDDVGGDLMEVLHDDGNQAPLELTNSQTRAVHQKKKITNHLPHTINFKDNSKHFKSWKALSKPNFPNKNVVFFFFFFIY